MLLGRYLDGASRSSQCDGRVRFVLELTVSETVDGVGAGRVRHRQLHFGGDDGAVLERMLSDKKPY